MKTGDDGLTFALKLRGRWVKAEVVADRWRIDDEWWREHPISRMYYQCVVDQGLKVTVYKDLVTGECHGKGSRRPFIPWERAPLLAPRVCGSRQLSRTEIRCTHPTVQYGAQAFVVKYSRRMSS